MKVVHLCADDGRGGAAIASARLSRALLRLGHDSRVLVAQKRSADPMVTQAAMRSERDEVAQIAHAAIRNRYVGANRTDLTNTHFTIHLDGFDAARHPLVRAADVVHLHWTSDLLTPLDVRALMETKPVAWTLHDLEPMTGGCHFPAGCEGYRDACVACPQLRSDPFGIPATTLRDKAALWAGLGVALASPSRWLAECARRSTVFGPSPRPPVVIPHALDTTVFRPAPRHLARAALGLVDDGPIVLCGAGDNREGRKGMDRLPRIVAACAEMASGGSGPTLVSVGASPLDLEGYERLRYVHLGVLADDDTMALAYAAADLFVLPSREDNMPNMLAEALCCGTPVVAFAVGGIGEVLVDGVNGRLLPPDDAHGMSVAMAALLADPEALEAMRATCRASVVDRYDEETVGRRYVALYGTLPCVAGTGSSGRLSEVVAGCRVGPALDPCQAGLAAACLALELKGRSVETEVLVSAAADRASLIETLHAAAEAQHRVIAGLERVAAERLALVQHLHGEVEAVRGEAVLLHAAGGDREVLIRALHEDAAAQRGDRAILQAIAGERLDLVEDLHRDLAAHRREVQAVEAIAAERGALILRMHEEAAAQRCRSENLERAAAERLALIEASHREVEAIRDEYAALRCSADERGALILRLHEDAVEQRCRSENLERAAAERLALIEASHREVEAFREDYAALRCSAEERSALILRLHEEAAAQRRRSDDLDRVAAERLDLIQTLHRAAESLRGGYVSLERVAEERSALIHRLHAEAADQRRHREHDRLVAAAHVEDPRAHLRGLSTGGGSAETADRARTDRKTKASAAVASDGRDLPPAGITPGSRPVLEPHPPRRPPWIALLRSVRFGSWWDQKIPPLTAVIYVTALVAGRDPAFGLKLLVTFVFMVACVAAYGHVINDVFDIGSDLRAGKPNPLAAVALPWRALGCVGFLLLGFIPVLIVQGSPRVALVLGLNYLWPTIYSVPGLRLKERGVLGLVCDAAGSHITPTILALVVVGGATGVAVPLWPCAGFVAWSTVLGFKGILYHQAADRENDVVSGVRTFATSRSIEALNRFFPVYNLLIELPISVLLTVECSVQSAGAPLIAVALGCYVALNAAKFRFGFPFALTAGPNLRRRTVPFADEAFYTVWLPIAAAFQVGARGSFWLLVPLLHGVAFHRQAALQWRDAASLLRHAGLGFNRIRHRNYG